MQFVLLGLVACAVGCKTDEQAELRAFSEGVSQQIQAGKFPKLRADTVEEMEFFRVSREMRRAAWFQPFLERVEGYDHLFLANVRTKQGEELKYFYGKQDGSFRRVESFSKKEGTWQVVN